MSRRETNASSYIYLIRFDSLVWLLFRDWEEQREIGTSVKGMKKQR